MDALGRKTCGAMRTARRVVLIPRRWDQALRDIRRVTEANKPGTPGRARYKP